jgi:hypothetical protein
MSQAAETKDINSIVTEVTELKAAIISYLCRQVNKKLSSPILHSKKRL